MRERSRDKYRLEHMLQGNVIWDVVTHDLPLLEQQVTLYIKEDIALG